MLTSAFVLTAVLFSGAGLTQIPSPTPAPAAPALNNEIAPDAKLVVEQYLTATGGRNGWSSLKTIQGNGTLSIPAASITGTAQFVISSDLYRNTFTMSGGSVQGASIITGRNGDVVWQMTGEGDRYNGKLLEGVTRLRNLRQYQFNQLLDLEKNFLRVEIVDVEEIDGSPAIKILMVPREAPDSKEYRFFDQSSHFIVRTIIEQPGGNVQEARYSGYKKVGPVRMHTETKRMASGQVLMLVATPNIVANKPLPEKYNELPLEIRVLLGEETVAPPGAEKPKNEE
ncbi:MAG: hypothetical protein VX527_01895 [Planctomycetota bacterium]|nr:hypothetical protein [Planctomycetota bacterium]